jgi:beta-lactamase class A
MRKFLLLILISIMISALSSSPVHAEDNSVSGNSLIHSFIPLPAPDPGFSEEIKALVIECGLDKMTAASENPDNEDEWASICVVDLSNIKRPVVGGWKETNFIYPASTYKMYILGEAIRQILVGKISLDDKVIVKKHNVRGKTPRINPGESVSVSKILRLMIMYSDNSAANEAIDLVNRENATALLYELGCKGSEITRKFLSRTLEDDGYSTVPSTTSNALHFATYLWAIETGAIGGGRGRGLIKAFLSTRVTGKTRMEAGLPKSATIYSKTGTWNIFSSEAALIEDGNVKYILCILTPFRTSDANPRIAKFSRKVYELMKKNGRKKQTIKISL